MLTSLTLLFQQYDWLFPAFAALTGLIVGSFLNVVIYRLPKMMEAEWQQEYQQYFQGTDSSSPAPFNLTVPRSHCPYCRKAVRATDNIPLFSWLWLKGKCRYCQHKISVRYPLIELLTAILSLFVACHTGFSSMALLFLIITWALVALTFIDIDKMLLPDQITLPLLWLILLFSAFESAPVNAAQAIIGAACGYLSLWLVFWGFKLVTGKEGMGYGDFKLMALFGALLGWQQLPLVILLSSLLGAIIGSVMLITQGRDKSTAIPFGPYIAVAGWIAMLYGESIVNSYLNYMGIN